MLVYYGYVYLHTGSLSIPIFRAQWAGLGVFRLLGAHHCCDVIYVTILHILHKRRKGILTLLVLHKTYNLGKNYCSGSRTVFYIDLSIFIKIRLLLFICVWITSGYNHHRNFNILFQMCNVTLTVKTVIRIKIWNLTCTVIKYSFHCCGLQSVLSGELLGSTIFILDA